VQANEGMVLVALMFLFTPLAMTWPMMGSGLGFLDAFFEPSPGSRPRADHAGDARRRAAVVPFSARLAPVVRGLGIIVLSLALLVQPGWPPRGWPSRRASSRTWSGAPVAGAAVLKVYGALTVLGVLGSLLAGFGTFDSVLFTFAAVSTGGSRRATQASPRGTAPAVWITLLCLLAPFP
jgi:trk system potassium uptake protein TrkH